MNAEQVFDRVKGLDVLRDQALMTSMLYRDPFDIVTWAKMHLTEKDMDAGDKLAFGLLYDKQQELCATNLEMN